ncbi:hypothetical protein TMatcc_002945 [Talaromyces marneffei ATCC 18224]
MIGDSLDYQLDIHTSKLCFLNPSIILPPFYKSEIARLHGINLPPSSTILELEKYPDYSQKTLTA